MTAQTDATSETIEIRRYPNRRYYDTSRSRHLTLEDIREVIRQGANVRVVDSQTGADITSKTLLQMILEFETPKVDLFTAPLLLALIRVNDQVVKGFFEKFFNQALTSFFAFQNQFEKQLREGTVLPNVFPAFLPWQAPLMERATPPTERTVPGSTPNRDDASLAATVQQLQTQMANLQARLRRPSRRRKTRKTN